MPRPFQEGTQPVTHKTNSDTTYVEVRTLTHRGASLPRPIHLSGGSDRSLGDSNSLGSRHGGDADGLYQDSTEMPKQQQQKRRRQQKGQLVDHKDTTMHASISKEPDLDTVGDHNNLLDQVGPVSTSAPAAAAQGTMEGSSLAPRNSTEKSLGVYDVQGHYSKGLEGPHRLNIKDSTTPREQQKRLNPQVQLEGPNPRAPNEKTHSLSRLQKDLNSMEEKQDDHDAHGFREDHEPHSQGRSKSICLPAGGGQALASSPLSDRRNLTWSLKEFRRSSLSFWAEEIE